MPPLVTDINLSLDDRFLYGRAGAPVSSSSMTSPIRPTRRRRGSIHIGGIVAARLTRASRRALNGGPQMVEISRDGKRVISPTRSTPWDEQFYPDGVKSWMVKIDADPRGGMTLDEKFFVEFDGCARTRSAWKGATPRRTPTATRKRDDSPEAGPDLGVADAAPGVYHGNQPRHGWLFAVALGMQQRKASAVAKSLVPNRDRPRGGRRRCAVPSAAILGRALPLAGIRYFVAAALIGLSIPA